MSGGTRKEKSFKGKGDKYPESGKRPHVGGVKPCQGRGPVVSPLPKKDLEIDIDAKRIKYGGKPRKTEGVKTGR